MPWPALRYVISSQALTFWEHKPGIKQPSIAHCVGKETKPQLTKGICPGLPLQVHSLACRLCRLKLTRAIHFAHAEEVGAAGLPGGGGEASLGSSPTLSLQTGTDCSQQSLHSWVLPRKPCGEKGPLQGDAASCRGTRPGEQSVGWISIPTTPHPQPAPLVRILVK